VNVKVIAAPVAPDRTSAAALWAALRPEQWTKNLLVFAALVFGGLLADPKSAVTALAAFLAFCALSSAVYLMNDLVDAEADRRHPVKQFRPIASGALSKPRAAGVAVLFALIAIGGAFQISVPVGTVTVAYLGLQAAYTLHVKHVVILDVLAIAAGFVLRAAVGAFAVNLPISAWLIVCTSLLALFLALGKRRHEVAMLGDHATGHRRILGEYSPYLLDQMISVVTGSLIVAYSMYTTTSHTAMALEGGRLTLTIPFVLYGVFRYLYLVHVRQGGGSPANLLLRDVPLLLCVALWGVTVIALTYVRLA
jgi:4-hydroxybenzoate polyprenyltransferase